MRIAIVSDIHGNAPALEAVLDEAAALGAEHVLALGDYVGYYYWPAEALRLLARWPNHMIKGNHEVMLESALHPLKTASESPRATAALRHRR